jgi:phosphoribosylanthranilate isomerase
MQSRKNLWIKVCGMRDPQNLELLCALSPEYVGFIFYKQSKRFVGNRPDRALFHIPGPHVKKVGVFVNEERKQLRKAIKDYGLDAVQLHGSESADYCRSLSGEALELIKVVDPLGNPKDMENYTGVVDYLLFDSAGEGRGGTGRKFDWQVLETLPPGPPFFLSGGIGPGDAEAIRNLELDAMMGVDVNSKFELSPGLKNMESLKKFITEIRK